MNIDLNLLRCFQVVSEKSSISEASSILHLSQPAISLQIKRLEEQIGRKLFDRHNRGLILTKFGEQFLERARRLLEVQDDLIGLVEKVDSEPSGILRVGTYTTASSYLLSGFVTDFLKQHQKVSLSYKYEESRILLEKIKDYRLDCAILTDVPEDKGLDSQIIYKDELIFAVATKRAESKLKQISPSRLSEFDFLSYPLRYDLCYRTVEAKFGAHLAKARVVVETESFDTLKQMLVKGAGATFIPKYLVQKELQSGVLTEIKVGSTSLPIAFSIVTKRDAELSHAARLFRAAVVGYFG